MRLIRASLLVLALAAGLALGTGPARPARAEADPAVRTVQQLYSGFEAALKAGAGTVRARMEAIEPVMTASFDFPSMARVAVGPKWKSLAPEQQAALTEAFRRYFNAMYATRLAQAAGGRFEVTPKSETRGTTRVVQTLVANRDGDDSQVDFVINADNRVQDVLLNGNVSEVASQRTAFAEPLKAGGADTLLKFLRERTDGMLAAKPAP